MRPEEDALKVDVHEEIVVVLVEVLDRRGLARHAGVVEGDVDPAEPVESSLMEIRHRFCVPDVDFREFDIHGLHRLDFVLEAGALSGAEAGHEQARSRLGESMSGGSPDPGGSPDEKDAFAGKVVGHLHREIPPLGRCLVGSASKGTKSIIGASLFCADR